MKINNPQRFFINIVLYAAMALTIYFLYSPLNKNPNNKTSSAIQFVYQQF
jgi:hypothetical protein